MIIIGQNFKLRRMSLDEWRALDTTLRAKLATVEGVGLLSLQPGLMEVSIDRPTERDRQATLAHLKAVMSDWRFSESGTYTLPEPVNLQVLG